MACCTSPALSRGASGMRRAGPRSMALVAARGPIQASCAAARLQVRGTQVVVAVEPVVAEPGRRREGLLGNWGRSGPCFQT